MLQKQQSFYDVVIVGAGVAGLMIVEKLSHIGLHIAVLEKNHVVARGPSTRNEGWLHRGSYHAGSINDRIAAIQVAKRCIYGHEQIRRFAPEAIEEPDCPSFALIKDPNKVDELVSRWTEAGVTYRHISKDALSKMTPEANLRSVAACFQVDDLSVNTPLLYRKLVSRTLKHDGHILTGCEVKLLPGGELEVTRGGVTTEFRASIVIYSMGYSAKDFFKESIDFDLPVRYWKSHLVVTSRLCEPGIFYVDSGEAAMMHHGDISIVGLNEDALVVDRPDNTVISSRADHVKEAIQRLFPDWKNVHSVSVACTKVDITNRSNDARSLNIATCEPLPNHICVFPGKLTESPYMADAITRLVHQRLAPVHVERRPCDSFRQAVLQ